MGPISTLRRFGDIATRWPRVVGLVGAGLVAEGVRVWWTTSAQAPVRLLGHEGLSTWDPVADRPFLLAYAGWSAIYGVVVMAMAVRWAMRARAAKATAGRAQGGAAVRPVEAGAVGGRAAIGGEARPVVQRMRRIVEQRRR